MKGSLCHEYETGIPAEEVWQVYGTLRLGQLLPQLLPHLFKSVELVEGDGGVGTILHLTFSPGSFFFFVLAILQKSKLARFLSLQLFMFPLYPLLFNPYYAQG